MSSSDISPAENPINESSDNQQNNSNHYFSSIYSEVDYIEPNESITQNEFDDNNYGSEYMNTQSESLIATTGHMNGHLNDNAIVSSTQEGNTLKLQCN